MSFDLDLNKTHSILLSQSLNLLEVFAFPRWPDFHSMPCCMTQHLNLWYQLC